MAENLLKLGKEFVDEKEWSVGLVLAVGAHLLDFSRKVSLGVSEDEICQIILTLLDDAEKADKERLEGSTPKGTSTVPWKDCKKAVKTLFEIPLFCSCLPFGLFSKAVKPEVAAKAVKPEVAQEANPVPVSPPESATLPSIPEAKPQVESETQVEFQVTL